MDEIRRETFTLTRTYGKCRDHVWSAWADRDKKWRWFVGNGEKQPSGDYQFDFRVGGTEVNGFASDRGRHENRTVFFEIAEAERIVFAYSMALNGRVHSVSVATVSFQDEGGGTRLDYAEQITLIGQSDGAEGRRHGWGALLDRIEPMQEAELG
jgi:uncharacterized protein YndB with AHSA1/START domain